MGASPTYQCMPKIWGCSYLPAISRAYCSSSRRRCSMSMHGRDRLLIVRISRAIIVCIYDEDTMELLPHYREQNCGVE
eukprot:scaffold327575_cov17-Prasinocladus_malaysianus.AAC.1